MESTDQQRQIISAIEACLKDEDHASIAKIIAKYPEAGAYALTDGTSLYLKAAKEHQYGLLLVAAASGFDFSQSLIDNPSHKENIFDVLCQTGVHSKEEARQLIADAFFMLSITGKAMEQVSFLTLKRAIHIDSVAGFLAPESCNPDRALFKVFSKSLDSKNGKECSELFDDIYFCGRAKDNKEFFSSLVEHIPDEAFLSANKYAIEHQGVTFMDKAITRLSFGAVYEALSRPAVAQELTASGGGFLQTAKDSGWDQARIAELECFLLGQISSNPGPAMNKASDDEPDISIALDEPKTRINRRAMF